MAAKIREFAEHLWYLVDKDIVTVGVLEEPLNNMDQILGIHSVEEGESVEADQILGDISFRDDAINLYAPVSGEVTEVNEAIHDSPKLIYEDPEGESWLFKIKVDDPEELAALEEEYEASENEEDDDDDDDLLEDDDDDTFEEEEEEGSYERED